MLFCVLNILILQIASDCCKRENLARLRPGELRDCWAWLRGMRRVSSTVQAENPLCLCSQGQGLRKIVGVARSRRASHCSSRYPGSLSNTLKAPDVWTEVVLMTTTTPQRAFEETFAGALIPAQKNEQTPQLEGKSPLVAIRSFFPFYIFSRPARLARLSNKLTLSTFLIHFPLPTSLCLSLTLSLSLTLATFFFFFFFSNWVSSKSKISPTFQFLSLASIYLTLLLPPCIHKN